MQNDSTHITMAHFGEKVKYYIDLCITELHGYTIHQNSAICAQVLKVSNIDE